MGQIKTVRSFVYDQSNGEPLAYEKVKLLREDSSTVAGAVTDLNGFFQIPKLKSDRYLIKVDNFKYADEIQNVDLTTKRNIVDVKFAGMISPLALTGISKVFPVYFVIIAL